MSTPKDAAIIGAGLAGCALALALNAHNIRVRIYESRKSTAPEIASGVVLTPNGLGILDKLGVYARIKDHCWTSNYRTYKNDRDETTRKILISGVDLYGFSNHRLWRRVLLGVMKDMLSEQGVNILYETKFEGIVSEAEQRNDQVNKENSNGSVTFLINGHEETADILIGADGIYSSVRKCLFPFIVPEYTGTTGVIAHIDRRSVAWPYPSYEKACTIQGKPGAFVLIPETQDGNMIMVAVQAKFPDQDRKGWEEKSKDYDLMTSFFRRGYDEWHETGRKIIDVVCAKPDDLYLWPFLKIPQLETWYSEAGRVVIVGDAAHAMPPSSAQGVNQALEDIWSLTLLITSGRDIKSCLAFWKGLRQDRVDAVFDWCTNGTNVQRMPEEERLKILKERQEKNPGEDVQSGFDDMKWLYISDAEEQIRTWIASRG